MDASRMVRVGEISARDDTKGAARVIHDDGTVSGWLKLTDGIRYEIGTRVVCVYAPTDGGFVWDGFVLGSVPQLFGVGMALAQDKTDKEQGTVRVTMPDGSTSARLRPLGGAIPSEGARVLCIFAPVDGCTDYHGFVLGAV